MTNPTINQDPNSHHSGKMSLAKKLITIGALLLGLILLLVLWALNSKSAEHRPATGSHTASAPDTNKRTTDGQVPALIKTHLDKKTEIGPKSETVVIPEQELTSPPPMPPARLTLDMQRSMAVEQQMRDYRQQQRLSAMASDTVVQFAPQAPTSQSSVDSALMQLNTQAQMLQARLAQTSTSLGEGDNTNTGSPGALTGKERDIGQLKYTREAPVSPYMLNVGTIIPATLTSGINSDLAGQVIASVSQNVYDSASGTHLLIPQGSQLYGVYDSQIAYGQSRVLLAWRRINFPDGTTLDLQSMGAMDTQGYAGFEDQVDNHYWKIFGNALLLGMISGGAQAGVSNNSNSDTPSAIADGVTQQFAQTGSSLIQKNLDVQPRITIRNGYRFNVMVNQDVQLSPYTPHR